MNGETRDVLKPRREAYASTRGSAQDKVALRQFHQSPEFNYWNCMNWVRNAPNSFSYTDTTIFFTLGQKKRQATKVAIPVSPLILLATNSGSDFAHGVHVEEFIYEMFVREMSIKQARKVTIL